MSAMRFLRGWIFAEGGYVVVVALRRRADREVGAHKCLSRAET